VKEPGSQAPWFGAVFRLLLALWAGSAWSLAIWVAPTLFGAQPDRHLAGVLAARLFGIETWVGLGVVGVALLSPLRRKFSWGYVAAGLLAVDEWGLKPVMDLAHSTGSALGLSFGAWHGVSALIYVAACLALVVPVFKPELS
jgi:hypothetical protein